MNENDTLLKLDVVTGILAKMTAVDRDQLRQVGIFMRLRPLVEERVSDETLREIIKALVPVRGKWKPDESLTFREQILAAIAKSRTAPLLAVRVESFLAHNCRQISPYWAIKLFKPLLWEIESASMKSITQLIFGDLEYREQFYFQWFYDMHTFPEPVKKALGIGYYRNGDKTSDTPY